MNNEKLFNDAICTIRNLFTGETLSEKMILENLAIIESFGKEIMKKELVNEPNNNQLKVQNDFNDKFIVVNNDEDKKLLKELYISELQYIGAINARTACELIRKDFNTLYDIEEVFKKFYNFNDHRVFQRFSGIKKVGMTEIIKALRKYGLNVYDTLLLRKLLKRNFYVDLDKILNEEID